MTPILRYVRRMVYVLIMNHVILRLSCKSFKATSEIQSRFVVMAHSMNKVLQHTRENYLGQQYQHDVISRMEF